MSKKKKQRPKVTPAVEKVPPSSGTRVFSTTFTFDTRRLFGTGPVYTFRTAGDPAPLADAVAEQIEDLTADFDGTGGEEMPTPPRDLTTYRDAFESARKKCDHEDAREVLFGREWICDSCHRMLNREDIRKSGWSRWG